MNIKRVESYPKAYAAFNSDESLREKSSSGGVFYLLAENVIKNGGVVFGARFNREWEVEHASCDDLENLQAFLGSKYVQSKMGDTFLSVKDYLLQGRLVLFIGTPCQTQGLKMYLEKDFDNLLIIDFICHGVPSPMVWRRYVNECFNKTTISSMNFRDKTYGWQVYSLKVIFKNDGFYCKNKKRDLYLKGFSQNLFLRPSCYDCKFKGIKRKTDITLADFWGIEDILPKLVDDKGTSLILLQSAKGERILNSLDDRLKIQPVNINSAVEKNPAAINSITLTERRNEFYTAVKAGGKLKVVIKKMTFVPLLIRIKKKLKM